MIALLAARIVALLLLSGTAWLTPALVRRTLPFGVRIPGDRADEPVITAARRRYRASVLAAASAVIAASTTVTATVGGSDALQSAITPSAIAILAVLSWAAYYRAHRTVATAKAEHSWYDQLPQGVAVDTTLRTDPERFPWLWALAAPLVVVATAITGALRHPHLPATLTTHWDSLGHATASVGAAFTPVLAQAGATAVLVGAALVALRSAQSLDAEQPAVSAVQHRVFVRWTARGLLVLAAGVDLSLLGTALQSWGLVSPSGAAVAATAVPTLLGVATVLAIALRTGQQGTRVSADRPSTTAVANRDDDRHWRAGIFYVNRDDVTVFVPKRFGVGWTVNLGRPAGWLAVAGTVAVPLALVLLGTALSR
ncbi:DUF5808 domain-containing protein [Kitasatospora sp. MAP5-34]|uniref:DUF1648 domain-containing protein n=1 Tax=Kitasatospora sp. MAP5-34 TaxID=3035102 RepID=UPI0024739653|nr:DUF5808 domain-containing protein [Kitasatospora sp. MAP5-34]MDH6576497.1 putative membrane protein [Kitasatospora sp. MAP5-34]